MRHRPGLGVNSVWYHLLDSAPPPPPPPPGPTALIVSDFKNDSYMLAGLPQTLADMWEADNGVGPFAPSDVLANAGLFIASGIGHNESKMQMTPTQMSGLSYGAGFTALLEYDCIANGQGFPDLHLRYGTTPTTDGSFGLEVDGVAHSITLANFNEPGGFTESVAGGSHKIAFTFDSIHHAMAVDGNAVNTEFDTTWGNYLADQFHLGIDASRITSTNSVIIIKKLSIFPVQADGDLVALSAP